MAVLTFQLNSLYGFVGPNLFCVLFFFFFLCTGEESQQKFWEVWGHEAESGNILYTFMITKSIRIFVITNEGLTPRDDLKLFMSQAQ